MTDPAKNSLVQLWLLTALLLDKKSLSKQTSFTQVNQHLTDFFDNFVPEQVQSQYSKLFYLASSYTQYLLSESKAIFGIKTLSNAICRLRDNNEQVCGSFHKEFAKLCIKAKCYQHALHIVEHPVTSFKKSTSAMDVLNYIYYKGLIFTGLKQYQKAINNFKIVIGYPSHCTHKIHLESYKKLFLLNLIVNGEMPTVPKYTSQVLKYKLENSFQNYRLLANTYISKEDKMFMEIIDSNFEEFEKDKNLGLIRKLQKSYSRVKICELSDTYLTLRYNEITASVKTLENSNMIEDTLFQMISEGQITAKIDSKQEMISFIDTTSITSRKQDEARDVEYLEVIEELEGQNKRIIDLMNQIQNVDSAGGRMGAQKDDSSGMFQH